MAQNSKLQASILWGIAIIITLASVIYQRKTGPTYPVEGSIDLAGEQIDYFFPRSQNTGTVAAIELSPTKTSYDALVRWKRYKSHDKWQFSPFLLEEDILRANLPSQPPAGKIIYEVHLRSETGESKIINNGPVIIRFKGAVPGAVLIPHILFMFAGMLLASRAGLAALVESDQTVRYTWLTGLFLLIGGLILGPVVQKYAFDAFWTGWPFGTDLTDNKTAVAFISWVLAYWQLKKHGSAKYWVIAAALITFLVYLVPHSAFGSELDYTKMNN